MLLLVVVIERIIHTTYTVTTDNKLVLYHGRFSKKKEINLDEILFIKRTSTFKLGRFALLRYVLIEYGTKQKQVALIPVREDLFIKTIQERCGMNP